MQQEQREQQYPSLAPNTHLPTDTTLLLERLTKHTASQSEGGKHQLDKRSFIGTSARIGPQAVQRSALKAKQEVLLFTAEGHQIYEAWCSLFTVAVPESPALVETANRLAGFILPWAIASNKTPAEVLQDIKTWMYATDRRGFYARGIKLCDVLRDVEGWQSAQERGNVPMQAPLPWLPSRPQEASRVPQKDVQEMMDDTYSLEALLGQSTQLNAIAERSSR